MAHKASKIDASFKDVINQELRIQGSSHKPSPTILNDYDFLVTVMDGFKVAMNSTLDLAMNSAHDVHSEVHVGRISEGLSPGKLDTATRQVAKSFDKLTKTSDKTTAEANAIRRDLAMCMMTLDE